MTPRVNKRNQSTIHNLPRTGYRRYCPTEVFSQLRQTKTNMARRGAVEPPKEEENALSYMQPEILPIQIMIDVLTERGMKAASLQEADRVQIIKLFHKYVCPKHQRDYRENRRGKIMLAMRRKRGKSNKDEDWKRMVMDSKERTLSSNSSDASAERLKPPPSCINTERKTIKLGGGSTKASGAKMDFIVVKRRSSEDDSQGPESKSSKLSSDDESSKRKDEKDHIISKKIKTNSDEDMESLENGKKMKHDRKPITWP